MRPDRRFAICTWSSLCTPAQVGPGEFDRITAAGLGQRVVRLGEAKQDFVEVHRGEESFRLDPSLLRLVDGIQFEVGDAVRYKGETAVVRDVIWHFKDNEPNYYVAVDGKRVSKRLRNSDVELTP